MTCGKPLQFTAEQRHAVIAVTSAVDAALGEVVRQGGALGNIAVEARSMGIAAGEAFLMKCGRARDHDGDCDQHGHRGVDYDCEECGARRGFFVERGFRRCKWCGYPSQ